jgi:hypothetical protein
MDTNNQMRALVGRRIHASAASSSDRRNLQEHESKVAGEQTKSVLISRLTLGGSRGPGVQYAFYPYPAKANSK